MELELILKLMLLTGLIKLDIPAKCRNKAYDCIVLTQLLDTSTILSGVSLLKGLRFGGR